ncbi:hypothetical protein WBP06_23405 [Novosphingobium sp. BL-8H]|uniref:hypothetical protein n=1 Tax=Novosphingobium sp. BL-8H TaxID=3127640 RepID=UPI003757F5A8
MRGRQHGPIPSVVPHAATAVSAVALAFAVLLPGPAAAQSQLPPPSPARQSPFEVDVIALAARNPFLETDDDAFTAAIALAAKGHTDWQLAPGTNLDADGAVAFRQYSRKYGNFLTGRAALALDHRHNEYLSFLSEASYERVLPTEAQGSSIDSAVDPLSLQDNYQLAQTVTWHGDALSTVSGRLGWTRLDPHGSTLLQSTSALALTLNAKRQIDPLTTLGAVTVMTWSRTGPGSGSGPSSGDDPHAWTAQLTAERRMGHGWRAQIALGATRTSQLNNLGQRQGSGVQFAGNTLLCHEPGHVSACITASVQPVISSYGGIRRETAVGASLNWRLTERGTLTANADYRRSPQSAPAADIDTMRLAARYDYRLNGQVVLFAGPEYYRRTGVGGQTVHSAQFQIGITIGIPHQ